MLFSNMLIIILIIGIMLWLSGLCLQLWLRWGIIDQVDSCNSQTLSYWWWLIFSTIFFLYCYFLNIKGAIVLWITSLITLTVTTILIILFIFITLLLIFLNGLKVWFLENKPILKYLKVINIIIRKRYLNKTGTRFWYLKTNLLSLLIILFHVICGPVALYFYFLNEYNNFLNVYGIDYIWILERLFGTTISNNLKYQNDNKKKDSNKTQESIKNKKDQNTNWEEIYKDFNSNDDWRYRPYTSRCNENFLKSHENFHKKYISEELDNPLVFNNIMERILTSTGKPIDETLDITEKIFEGAMVKKKLIYTINQVLKKNDKYIYAENPNIKKVQFILSQECNASYQKYWTEYEKLNDAELYTKLFDNQTEANINLDNPQTDLVELTAKILAADGIRNERQRQRMGFQD